MTSSAATQSGRGLLPLFFSILGPPVIWAVRIAANYVLVPYACWWGWLPVMHATSVVALLGTVAAGWVGWRRWRAVGGGSQVELGGTETRTRFMALFGILSSAFFFLVMVAEWLANFMVDPCQTAGAPLV